MCGAFRCSRRGEICHQHHHGIVHRSEGIPQNVTHLSVQGFGVDMPEMRFVTVTPVPAGTKFTLPGPRVTLV